MTTGARIPPADPHREILLVDDNLAYARLLQEVCAETSDAIVVHHVPDGETAVKELKRRLSDPEATLPDLALVDLNLPGRDGCGVIGAIRADRGLQRLPAIILTSSDTPRDITRGYECGANAYLTKPAQLDELSSLVTVIKAFWFGAARLPPPPR